MSTTTALMPISDKAVRPPSRRKSAPMTERYPKPDPHDPFAPLWVLRVRQAESATDLTTLGQEEPSIVSYPSPPASPVSSKSKELEFPHPWQKSGHKRERSNTSNRTIDPESVGPRPGWRRRSQLAKKRSTRLPPIGPPTGYHSSRASISSNKTAPVVHTNYDSSTNTIELSTQTALENQRAYFSMNTRSSGPLTFADDIPFSSDEGAQFDYMLNNFSRVHSRLAISTLPSPPSEPTNTRPIPVTQKPNKLRRRKSSASAIVYSSTFAFPTDRTRTSSESFHGYASQPENTSTKTTIPHRRKRTNSFSKLKLRRPSSADGRGPLKELSHQLPVTNDEVPPLPILPFDEHALPTEAQLSAAASLSIIAESGVRVEFGDLWRTQKAVVLFIRHFWCVWPHVRIEGPQILMLCFKGVQCARTICFLSQRM
jgi:hypothetical protein